MYGNNLKPKDESSNVAFIEDLLEKESAKQVRFMD